jgi:hypothetical protein
MGSPSRARRPTGLRGVVLHVGVAGLLYLPATGTFACGRIGFDPLPEDGGGAADASTDHEVPPDAFADATTDAPVDAFVDAPDDAEPVDAPSGSDSTADAACVVSAIVDYCAALPPLPAAPVIDGVLDCGPALVAVTPLDWNGPPPLPPFPAGNSAELAVAWRPDGLYVFMNVTTPLATPAELADPAFYGAGIELFVDSDGAYASAPTYDDPGALQLVVTAPVDAMTTSRRAEGFRNAADDGPWASTQFGAFPSPSGFVFEGFVAAADLALSSWSLASGQQVGFDVAIDVSFPTSAMTGPQGHRVGQYFLHVGTPPNDASAPGAPYSDPRSFCTPTLAPM